MRRHPFHPPNQMSTQFTPEQIERNREFLKDLRANPNKAVRKMRDHDGGRCCLGVAYDTAQRLGGMLPKSDRSYPPYEIADFYGWGDRDPRINSVPISILNDGDYTHCQIADAFEETFPELKP